MFQICIGLALLALTLVMHLTAVNVSLTRVSARIKIIREDGGALHKTILVMTYVIFLSLVLLVEAIVWAIAFLAMGVASGFWQAVYFSIVTLTTLGYGDLVPPENAQMVAAFCAMAGLFLVGLSTAFVVEILRRIDT
ncbi:MAG: potassium channel family protein [Pseudomonadota bacterium]